MSAGRHASAARTEAQRLRILLEEACARHLAGQVVEFRDLNVALQLARITEYHAARTMVAIGHGSSRASDNETEASPCL